MSSGISETLSTSEDTDSCIYSKIRGYHVYQDSICWGDTGVPSGDREFNRFLCSHSNERWASCWPSSVEYFNALFNLR